MAENPKYRLRQNEPNIQYSADRERRSKVGRCVVMVVAVMMSMVVAMMVVRGMGGRARRRRLVMGMAMVVMVVVVRAHQSRRNPGSHAENMDDGAALIVL